MPSTTPIGHLRPVERAALLDVQLDVGVPRAAAAAPPSSMRSGSPPMRRIASRRLQTVPHLVEVAGLEIAGDDAAAAPCRCRTPCSPRAPTSPSRADAGSHAPVACTACSTSSAASVPRSPSKLPPLGTESICEPNRIGGRADAPSTRTKMLPAAIDPSREARRPHLLDKPRARRHVGVGVGHPGHAGGKATVHRPAEGAQVLEAPTQTCGIDGRAGLRRPPRLAKRRRTSHREQRTSCQHGRIIATAG